MSGTVNDAVVLKALTLLGEHCPRLVGPCYWAGTSSIAIEVLHHRQSFDLDFHTRKAHVAWSDKDIEDDLAAYRDVDPGDAKRGRELLVQWLKESSDGTDGWP